jgi:hypothetical protein
MLMRSGSSEPIIKGAPGAEVQHIINAARQAWSIVDKKY